ncbi:MAG: PAS domain-containing sensor histidine kinase [Flavisolibacter sp.]
MKSLTSTSRREVPPATPYNMSLDHLLDTLPYFICAIDANGMFVFVNKTAENILGYSQDELKEKSFFDLLVETDLSKTKKMMEFILSGADISNFRNQYIKKDGSILPLSWTGKWNEKDRLIYCSAYEVRSEQGTERLHLEYEKKLKEHNRQLSEILDRIGDGFIALDENARVIYWNRQAEIITGKQREEVLTREIWDGYPQTLHSNFYTYYKKAIETQTPQRYESLLSSDEDWYEISLYPSNKGLTGFLKNITERKSIDEHLEYEKRQTQKKITAAVIKAQESERAEVSQELHDNVNQVLTTVKLYTELCMSNGSNSAELLKKSSELLQYCINEIRILSRQLSAPSLGKIRMKDSIKELVETIAATGKTDIKLDTKDILDLEVGEELHLAIYRILQEHLTNILKHADASMVKIVINLIDDDLFIKVTDNGRGFNVYEKKGGIGIANMLSRAESLGGRLSINSAPGLGCVLIAHFEL